MNKIMMEQIAEMLENGFPNEEKMILYIDNYKLWHKKKETCFWFKGGMCTIHGIGMIPCGIVNCEYTKK